MLYAAYGFQLVEEVFIEREVVLVERESPFEDLIGEAFGGGSLLDGNIALVVLLESHRTSPSF